jgi:hypothetical protein
MISLVFQQVLQAVVQMGVLVPTGDMTVVRRTTHFFLNSWFTFSREDALFLTCKDNLLIDDPSSYFFYLPIFTIAFKSALQHKWKMQVATAELGFRNQLSKEKKFEKKKQGLATIGNGSMVLTTINEHDRWKHCKVYEIVQILFVLIRTTFCRSGSFGNCCWSTISISCHFYIRGQSILRFEYVVL